MRYYVIAGERSGDLHAGNLVRSIREYDKQSVFRGFGGAYMQHAGVDLAVHYSELAVMGFAEVVKNLNKISGFIRKCKQDILQFKPDVVILVDYGGFNQRIAKFARSKKIKVFYYISPKVWAWYQKRALQLKKNVDRMFVILPFEKDFFRKFNWNVDYVGNPVMDAIKAHQTSADFLTTHQLSELSPVVALLPGSRKQELVKIIPVMASVVKRFPDYQFAVARVGNLEENLYASFNGLSNVKFVYDDTYNLLSHADAAVVTSGTATLETALFRVPQIVVYKTSGVSYHLAKWLIQVPFISLVNLIRGKQVVKELIQREASEGEIAKELNQMISNKEYRQKILAEYEVIKQMLDTGSASENAARLMVGYLNENSGEGK